MFDWDKTLYGHPKSLGSKFLVEVLERLKYRSSAHGLCLFGKLVVILTPYSGFKFIELGFIQRCLCVQNVTRVPKRVFCFGLDEGFRCLEANFPKICSTNGKILRVCS